MLGNEKKMLAYFENQFSLPYEDRDITYEEMYKMQIDTSLVEMLHEISSIFWEQPYYKKEVDNVKLSSNDDKNYNELKFTKEINYNDSNTTILNLLSDDFDDDINLLKVA